MDSDFAFKEETDRLNGCAFAVLNEVGHGDHETPYENSLAVEFRHRDMPVVHRPRFSIHCRGVEVSEYVPDLFAFDQVIVDTKVVTRVTDHEIGKMLNDLRIASLPAGLMLNCKKSKLEVRRVVISSKP